MTAFTIHPRCPICTAPTEANRCGLGCHIARCPEPECRELYAVDEGHDCELPPLCDDCGDPIEDGTGCHHEGDYCASCFLHHCRECADDYADDLRAEARMERWRDER